MGQLRRSAGVPRRRAGRLPQISRDLAKAGIRFLQAVNEAKHLVGDAAAAWVDSPSAENFFAQVDGAIDRMDPMLVEFSLFVLENFGPEQAGYLYGMILYEVAETAVITTVTVGAGAVVKAGLLPKFVNRVMKLPFVADNPKLAKALSEFVVDFSKGVRVAGELWGDTKALRRFLEERGITFLENQDELLNALARRKGKAGATGAFIAEKKAFILASNPTRREVLHELAHYHLWRRNPSAYGLMSEAVREDAAVRLLRTKITSRLPRTHRWDRFTPEEQWKELKEVIVE